jgi:NADPH-dependent 2,4-dienoyl-CoA reductase/sulfur reductase-like enzyme
MDVRTRHEVTTIDVEASAVTVRDLDSRLKSTAHYDELLIGTGASGISPR